MTLNQKNKNTAKQKMTTLIFTFIIFFVFLIYFFILPSINKIKEQKATIINEKINLLKTKLAEKNIKQSEIQLKKINSQVDKINQIFINKNDELNFITTIENIANKNHVTQKLNFSPSPKKKELFSEVPITISVNGDHENTLNFLSEIISLNSVYINQFEISKQSANNSLLLEGGGELKTIINLKISATTYWK